MRRPVPIEALIMDLIREKNDIWFNDLIQALRAWYPDITEKEVLMALMKLELSRLIITQKIVRKDGVTYHIRVVKD
ncbi:MAG: hypothetical protein ACP5GZ_06790 [Vulcanisaeta sp.]|jgi:hypothetical protein|uniref:ArsR family transcriptional regulator n=1 Tax=Vulcanisaeta moutnovskia (strain 768-28) TaxID=985053 RepID=F0QXB0_VULM7|nr:hypothetical protein [Vulcanisaeta moutnovskia]ADY01149.1 hypothetical protein VMUT_0939 [Vulcanisaeta moutnovskia 768-28]